MAAPPILRLRRLLQRIVDAWPSDVPMPEDTLIDVETAFVIADTDLELVIDALISEDEAWYRSRGRDHHTPQSVKHMLFRRHAIVALGAAGFDLDGSVSDAERRGAADAVNETRNEH